MSKPYEPYQQTAVPVERSKEAIRQMLLENGAVAHQFSERTDAEIVEISWARKVILDDHGKKSEFVQPCRIRVSYHNRDIRQVFRVIYHHLKAKFEIVRFGILSFEEEFLPFFVIRMPDGSPGTIAEAMLPQLRKGLAPSILPLCLPAAREEDK
jgi:hypothetical protein